MNIFKKCTLEWWEVSLLKIAVLAIGLAVGATWPEVFEPYITFLVALGLVLGIYIGSIWLKR